MLIAAGVAAKNAHALADPAPGVPSLTATVPTHAAATAARALATHDAAPAMRSPTTAPAANPSHPRPHSRLYACASASARAFTRTLALAKIAAHALADFGPHEPPRTLPSRALQQHAGTLSPALALAANYTPRLKPYLFIAKILRNPPHP